MDALSLADFRARVGPAMYLSDADVAGLQEALRDELFATHPQAAAPGPLRYFPVDPAFSAVVR